ncbi:phosphate/phosphite/phosphonate ABC transporter substrate-binding protein [Zavarzinella formosa]|uniref:phosphate/phosphite/phosphonate ABC transporter substrate-binding protein n=1 Tax=Zavarzinella formosa TaxID=360055 RepID=UPI00036CDEE4|nr:phosphate/phosphite/phosphonate ABC transporter substrate-binding protein [Zavarzinella formosa]
MNNAEPVTAFPKKPNSYKYTISFILLLVAAAGGYYFYEMTRNATLPVDDFVNMKPFFAKLADRQKLADEYADANKDMVADTPTDAAKLLKVEEIGFSAVGTIDEERLKAEQEDWKDLMAALEKATGKKVKYLTDLNGADVQMDALKTGRLHVTAFNTGAVPAAVNSAGFVPLFCPANSEGQYGYQMQILVKADSAIQKPEDLKGKKIGFVAMSSNSGARAPMYTLKEKFGLLPGRDYTHGLTGDHFSSIGLLVYGNEYDAVCVASDLKDRAVTAGKIRFGAESKELKADQFRVIYTSDTFPPLCFGVPHNLPPEMRATVEKVFKDYQFANSSAKKYAQQGKVKFAPVNYEKDWKFVREIDATLSKFTEIP